MKRASGLGFSTATVSTPMPRVFSDQDLAVLRWALAPFAILFSARGGDLRSIEPSLRRRAIAIAFAFALRAAKRPADFAPCAALVAASPSRIDSAVA